MYLSNYLGHLLRSLRGQQSILQISQQTGIDQALISKYEGGKRRVSPRHLDNLKRYFSAHTELITQAYLRDQIIDIIGQNPEAENILNLVRDDLSQYQRSEMASNNISYSEDLVKMLQRADELKSEWDKFRPIDALQLQKMREYFHLSYTYESNQIEGNTLSLQETKLVIEEGMTIGGKSLREHLEAINHQNAILFLEEIVQKKQPLTKSTLLQIHRIILFNISNQHASVFRTVPVRISGSDHIPVQPYLIEKLMEDYFIFYEENKSRLHPIILAAEMHEQLVSIHPFIDGNGRSSRSIMNLILLQNAYCIANIKGDPSSRIKYYRALEESRKAKNKEPFYALIAEACILALEEHLALTAQ